MVEEGEWRRPLTPRAEADLAAFSEIMVDKFFCALSGACRAVDPNHLNLGVRYQGVPPAWAVEGMRSFDVFSLNCYEPRVRATDMEKIYAMLEAADARWRVAFRRARCGPARHAASATSEPRPTVAAPTASTLRMPQ